MNPIIQTNEIHAGPLSQVVDTHDRKEVLGKGVNWVVRWESPDQQGHRVVVGAGLRAKAQAVADQKGGHVFRSADIARWGSRRF